MKRGSRVHPGLALHRPPVSSQNAPTRAAWLAPKGRPLKTPGRIAPYTMEATPLQSIIRIASNGKKEREIQTHCKRI
eukprot:157371-Pyramimonas_sp.AAC.1